MALDAGRHRNARVSKRDFLKHHHLCVSLSLKFDAFTGERRSKEREEPHPPPGPMIEEYNHGKEFPTLKTLPGLKFRRRADPREPGESNAAVCTTTRSATCFMTSLKVVNCRLHPQRGQRSGRGAARCHGGSQCRGSRVRLKRKSEPGLDQNHQAAAGNHGRCSQISERERNRKISVFF